MKILLTGSTGQVGWELNRALPALDPSTDVVAPEHSELDLADADALRAAVGEIDPDVIINAACFTAVDEAEHQPDRANLINGRAPGVLAESAKKCGAAFVHYSTDYVFDGAQGAPYRPDDETNPINAYGQSKLLGEQAVRAAGGESLILRLSWVYSLRRHNFLRTMLELARQRDHLRVVDDQVGCPTWSRLVAQWTVEMLRGALHADDGRSTFGGRAGTYHLACSGATSRFGFARRIIELAGLDERVTVEPIRSSEYPTAARRPAYSCLDCEQSRRTFGLSFMAWDDALGQVMNEYRQASSSITPTTAQGA